MNNSVFLTNIQRFSLHDGPGIRTTVFLKGCSLCCPWCSNPENIHRSQEHYSKDGICGIYGYYMNSDELYCEIMKDVIYYEPDGGITYSGGEALLQAEALQPLIKRLNQEGVNQCVETSLFVPTENMKLVAELLDLFYVDIKLLNKKKCKELLNGNLESYLQNIDWLVTKGKKIVFRIPVIPCYTDDMENMNLILKFLAYYKAEYVELICGHNLGSKKYETLGIEPPHIEKVSEIFMAEYKERIEQLGIRAQICKV